MNIIDITICWKRSGWQWDLHRYPRHDVESLRRFYLDQNRDPDRMQASHARQMENLTRVQDAVSKADIFVSRNDLSRERLNSSKLFVVGGGDNHFTWASHYCPFDLPILPINSDQQNKPNEGSDGGMLSFNTDEFLQLLPALLAGEFEVDEWTLLELLVDGKHMGYATSELFIGEKERTNCSRNWIRTGNKDEQHVGSGDVFATPAGVSGWYRSAVQQDLRLRKFADFLDQLTDRDKLPDSKTLFQETLDAWNSSEEFVLPDKHERAMFLANTERFTGGGRSYELCSERIEEEEVVRITSLNDSEGIIRIDADEALTSQFPPGCEAIVRVAKETLKVVRNPFRV